MIEEIVERFALFISNFGLYSKKIFKKIKILIFKFSSHLQKKKKKKKKKNFHFLKKIFKKIKILIFGFSSPLQKKKKGKEEGILCFFDNFHHFSCCDNFQCYSK